jgi:hypothetical protein
VKHHPGIARARRILLRFELSSRYGHWVLLIICSLPKRRERSAWITGWTARTDAQSRRTVAASAGRDIRRY